MRLSFEVDGLYRPINVSTVSTKTSQYPTFSSSSSMNYNSWELPVRVRYSAGRRAVAPFVLGGPAFRFFGNPLGQLLSGKGVVAGAGASFRKEANSTRV